MPHRRLDSAITRATRHLTGLRQPEGYWSDVTDLGPAHTAMPLIALWYAGHPLPEADLAKVLRRFRRQQRPDGSFDPYPYAGRGDLGATALVHAAMRVSGLTADDPCVAAAWSWVEGHGGLDGVVRALMEETNFAALFVAMTGAIDPGALPMPPPALVLTPPVQALLKRRYDAMNIGVSLVAAGAIVSDLRRQARARIPRHEGLLGLLESAGIGALDALDDVGDDEALAFLTTWQNPNGSLDDTALQTALLVAAYKGLGLKPDEPRLARAAAWMRGMRVESPGEELWISGFAGDVWNTALAGRALLEADVRRDDPRVTGLVRWFLDHRITDASRVMSSPRPGSPKTGGWAFEGANVTLPDCDDTGLVLTTLGLALRPGEAGDELPEELRAEARVAVEEACDWLEGMQNPDGGWSAFDWWEGSKPRGPMYTDTVGFAGDGLLDTIKRLLDPPITLGSPAWEDVTARVLQGLGHAGWTADAPMVARAIAFLRAQQLDDGSWWGRWMVNYLPTTACAVMGLVAVGLSPSEPMVRRGLSFLLAHQNEDGGWGEDEETYADPSLAGTGPSNAPLTGLVLTALLQCGEAASEAVARGVEWLLREQRPDGTWPNGEWLHAFFPPSSFYLYPMMPALYPLEALARHRAFSASGRVDLADRDPGASARAHALGEAPRDPSERPPGPWDDAWLDRMRLRGDPLVDDLVGELVSGGQAAAAGEALAAMIHSDDPVPEGLPADLRDWLSAPPTLPSFAEPEALDRAARLFTRAPWEVAGGLFCSALPQTYAAAKGAKVLVYSGRMGTDARRRILETAQFIFDVTAPGGLRDRGYVTIRKVRLVHATLRHLVTARASWDMDDGLPINQEDLGGTLMTFSCVVLEALDRFGVEMEPDDRAAWMHLWTVVGALLGVEAALLPRDEADGLALMDAVRRRHWRPSPQGAMLARALIDSMAQYVPGEWADGLPVALLRHFAGDACADILGLPSPDWTLLLAHAAIERPSARKRNRRSAIARLVHRLNAELMRGVIAVQRDAKQAPFRLPTSLRG